MTARSRSASALYRSNDSRVAWAAADAVIEDARQWSASARARESCQD